MKKGKAVALTAVLGIALTFPSAAQDSPSRVTLSLEQAQEFAVEHNRTLENASIDVQKAQAGKWQAIASLLPQVKASVDYSNSFGYKMDLGGMKISMPANATLGVTTSVGFNGAMVLSLQVSEISKRMSDITLQKSEKQIRDQVKVLYCSALVSEQTLALLNENKASIEKLYQMSLKSVEVGVSEQTAADQLKVQLVSMENSIISLGRSLEMIYNSLRIQLCLDEETEIILTDGISDIMNLQTVSDILAEEFDLDLNYDYRLLKESTDLSKKQISITGWSSGPTVSVYHQYSAKKYFSDEARMNMTPPNMLGVQLSVPIFTSGKTSAAIKDAKLAYQKQLNTLEDTELALKVQYRQLVYNLRTAIENYEAQKQSVDVAQSVFDNIAKKYEHGVASSMDVTNSGTSLISAQSSYVQALLDIVNAQISLEQLLNK